jgi:hypothetical protein
MAHARRCRLTKCWQSCATGWSVAAFRSGGWRYSCARSIRISWGAGSFWRPGAGVEVRDAPFDLLESAVFRDSPVAHVYARGKPIRRRLADADCSIEFPMLKELQDEGVSDYLASPLLFTDGEIHLATWTTRQPGGFTDAQIDGIESIVAPLARVAEVRALRRTASNLSIRMSVTTLANVFSPARYGAATPKRSMPQFGCPICVDSLCWPTVCRRRPWLNCLMDILTAKFLRSSTVVAKFSSSWATACWQSSRSKTIPTRLVHGH